MGGGNTESNTVAEYKPPPWAEALWPEAVARGYDISNVYGSGQDLSWQGPFAAPLVTEQVDAIGGLRGMAMPMFNDPQWMRDRQAQGNTTLMSGLGGGMKNSFGGATNPEFERMLASTRQGMEDSFARGTAAQTNAAAARGGAFGGSAHNELGAVQGAELAKQIGGMEAGLRSDQYNRAAQLEESGFARQLQSLGMMPGIQGQEVNLLQSLLGAGEMSRGLDQQELEGAMGRHYQNVQQPLMALDILLNTLARSSGGSGQTSSQILGPNWTGLQRGLAGGALGAGLFG